MAEVNNTLLDLQKYLGVSGAEFRSWWNTLTVEEKAEFKSTPLDS